MNGCGNCGNDRAPNDITRHDFYGPGKHWRVHYCDNCYPDMWRLAQQTFEGGAMKNFPGAAYDAWKTTDPVYTNADRARALELLEEERAERWARLTGELTDFAREEKDGWAAATRCLAAAMAAQPTLFK